MPSRIASHSGTATVVDMLPLPCFLPPPEARGAVAGRYVLEVTGDNDCRLQAPPS
jgi:hypothetical protein